MEIRLSAEKYEKVVIEKTIINFEGEYQVAMIENDFVITLPDNSINTTNFYEELFFNDLRFNIAKETNTIKKLIIGRALYETCIKRG